MADKIINTRIQLKYDTLENWKNSTGILKAGEVAIATVPAGSAGQEVGSVATPQVLVKVGDGKSTFTELPYITAKAGDVYAWAKAEKLGTDAFSAEVQRLFTDIENDITALEGKVGNTNVTDQITAAVNAAIEGLDVADAAVEKQFVVAVPQTDGKVAVERRALTADDIPELAQDKVTGLTTKLSNIDTEIAGIKNTETGILAEAKKYTDDEVKTLADGAVATNTAAIAAINNAETGILKQAKDYADTQVNNAKTELKTYAEDEADDAYNEAVKYVDDAIAAITGGETGSLSALEARVKANEDAIGEMPAAGEDGVAPTLVGMIAAAEKTADDAVKAEAERATNAETALEGRIEDMEAFWEAAQTDGTDANVIDTLKEIQEYIASDETGAAAMAASIKANTDAIEVINGSGEGSLAKVAADAAQAVADEKTRAESEEAKNADAAKAADNKAAAAQTAVNTLDGKIGDVAENKTVVEMIADAQAAATYNDTEVRNLIGGNTTAINNEVTRATNAENAIKAEIGVDDQDNYVALEGGHTTLIAAINAANTGVGTNAGEIADIKEQLGQITGDEGILGAANAYTDDEIEKVNNTITTLSGEVVKTVTGDDYIKVTQNGNNVTLAFDATNIILNCGTSADL